MTDRQAAATVGLQPDSAAYTKSKPSVRAFMIEHRAAVEQQFVQQQADLSRVSRLAADLAAERAAEGLRRFHLEREQVLERLWEIANMNPEMTRGSLTGQVKALSMIVAIEGLIPDRRAVPAQNKTAPPPVTSQIYQAAWLGKQQGETIDPQPGPATAQEEDETARPGVPWGFAEPEPTPGPAGDAPPPHGPVFDTSVSAFANRNRQGGLIVVGVNSVGEVVGTNHFSEEQRNSIANIPWENS